MNMETKHLLREFLTEEILINHFIHEDDTFIGLTNACDNFVYLHDLTNIKICEELSNDFEVCGYVKYNVNSGSDLFLEIILNYKSGDLDNIEYEVKNTKLFNNLVDYSLSIVTDNIKKAVKTLV